MAATNQKRRFTCDETMVSNPLLRRYWFDTDGYAGVGVTAFSLEDAVGMFQELLSEWRADKKAGQITENVDVRQLRAHVKSSMGPPNFRGVWYPRLNLYRPYKRQ